MHYQIVSDHDHHLYLVQNGRIQGQIRQIGETDYPLYSGLNCPIFYPKELDNWHEIKGHELVADEICFVSLPELASEYYEPLRNNFNSSQEFLDWRNKELRCRQDNSNLKAKISNSNDLNILTQLEYGDIYCDASASENGETKIGIYNKTTNEAISFLGERGKDKNEATTRGEWQAIQTALRLFPQCRIFSDSKWIVHRINKQINVNLEWIPRGSNREADFLTKSNKVGYGHLRKHAQTPKRGWLDFVLTDDIFNS